MEVKIKEEVKKEEMCRLCLGDQPWLHVFDERLALAVKVESLCRFKMAPDDELPKYICSSCAETLDAAISFRDRCEASDDRLRRQLHEPQPQNIACNIDPLNLLVFSDKSKPKMPKKPKRASIDPVKPKIVRIRSVKPKSAGIRSTKPKRSRGSTKTNKICPFCSLTFIGNFSLFEKHLATHKDKPFTCDHCGRSYVHKSHLIFHMKSHRPSPKKPKRASIRPVKPKRDRIRSEKPKSARSHSAKLKKARIDPVKPKRASLCQTKPKKGRGDRTANKFSYACPFCGLSFIGTVLFEQHLATHEDKPFRCDDCGKCYIHRRHLIIHMKSHRPSLQCEICGRRFSNSTSIRRHMDATHRLGDTLQCDICQSFFYRKQSLITHMVSHMGIKKFKCNLCGTRFACKELRDCHMKTHTGEKPFACKTCGARFAAKRTFIDHVRLHTGETPHHCPICDKGFVQLSNMKSHFRNNHKGVPFIYQDKRTSFPKYITIKDHVTYENDKEICK